MTQINARQYQRRRTAGQWSAENPVLASGEIGVVGGGALVGIKIGDGATAWNSLPGPLWVEDIPELSATDPSEIALVTTAGATTIDLLNTIARTPLHRVGQYYANFVNGLSATGATMTQNRLILQPVFLSKGTVDRIGVEVTTAVASLVCRLGIYADDSGLPNALVAEATTTADCSTTGVKDLTISAILPVNGRYWLGAVTQVAAGGVLRAPTSAPPQVLPLALGTVAPTGAVSYNCRRQDSVTGALPSTLTALLDSAPSTNFLVHYRYSSVG